MGCFRSFLNCLKLLLLTTQNIYIRYAYIDITYTHYIYFRDMSTSIINISIIE